MAITVIVATMDGDAENTAGGVTAEVGPEVTVEAGIVTGREIGVIGIGEELVIEIVTIEAVGDVVAAVGALVVAGRQDRLGHLDTVVARVEVAAGAEVMERDRHRGEEA